MAEFDELLITTGVDALVRLVKEKGKIEVDSVASLLNIPQKTIEEWAHILEEEGIISIEYKLTKSYLVWVAPSAEEAAAKKAEIYEEKKGVSQEIDTIRSRVSPQLESFEDLKATFSKFYDKSYPKLEQLEHALGGLAKPGEVAPLVKEDVKKILLRITTLDDSLGKMKGDIDGLKAQLARPLPDVKIKGASGIQGNLASLSKRLIELESKSQKLSKALPEDMPKLDAKKAVESMKKEFGEIRKACAIVRDDLVSIGEASQLVKGMGEELKGYDKDMASVKKNIDALSQKAAELSAASNEITKKLKMQSDALGHFSESIDVAKSVIARFPTSEKFESQLKEISKREESLEEKMEALDKLSSMPKDLFAAFEELEGKIEKEKEFFQTESETLSKAISDQSSVYSTFQKIRERALVSMQAYYSQLRDISQEAEKLKKQTQEATRASESGALAYKGKIKEKEYGELMKAAEDIVSKKQLLDRIAESFDSLSMTAENLNRELDILSKKARLLEVRQGTTAAPAAVAEGKQEVTNQVKLTRDEEEEFRRKRDELRGLIKRLWEEQS